METPEQFLARHDKVVLMLSAGKDSGACLKLLRPHLDRIMVMWVNPGHPYPETLEYMSRVQRSVPHFQLVRGHQPEFVARFGHPADTVPFAATQMGHILTRSDGPMLVPVDLCCRYNMWNPAHRAMRDYGATGCIRGDKHADPMHSDVVNGELRDGIEFYFPLLEWSDQQVFDYLGDDVPPSYKHGMRSSLDCINCTAYLAENPGRIAYLREHYPEAHAEVEPIIHWIRNETRQHLAALEQS